MPSGAFGTFRYNLVDVERLAEAYDALAPTGQGRRGLGHLTRSSIVTLCACWEQYAEDVIIEGVELIRAHAETPDGLPDQVKRVLSGKVKNAQHELKPLELAGDGWRDLYLVYAREDVARMHSPKAGNIQELMANYLGVTEQVSDTWTCGKDGVNAFVGLRNSIAHKGRAEKGYTKIAEVRSAMDTMYATVVETDNFVQAHLREYLGARPWNQAPL